MKMLNDSALPNVMYFDFDNQSLVETYLITWGLGVVDTMMDTNYGRVRLLSATQKLTVSLL